MITRDRAMTEFESKYHNFLQNRLAHVGNSRVLGDCILYPDWWWDIKANNKCPSPVVKAIKEYWDDKYHCVSTHFDLRWVEVGKSIAIRIFSAKSYGACLDLNIKNLVAEELVVL